MAALLQVVDLRRLPQPHVPVKPGRNRHRRERPLAQARRHVHRDLRQLADPPVSHQLAREAEQLVAALLCAGLQHDFVLRTAFTSPLAFVDGERQRLLGVNVLCRPRPPPVDQRVPVIRRRLDDDVDVLPFEHLAEVGELGWRLAVLDVRLATAAAWLSSTSQTATTSPNRLALFRSPVPMPPQPISATPGRSLGEVTAGACVAASSSRCTNHNGSPVAAAMVAQSLTKVRRET